MKESMLDAALGMLVLLFIIFLIEGEPDVLDILRVYIFSILGGL